MDQLAFLKWQAILKLSGLNNQESASQLDGSPYLGSFRSLPVTWPHLPVRPGSCWGWLALGDVMGRLGPVSLIV